MAEGVELIGEYEGSGFKQAPYLARRSDGQTIQLTKLLYLVAEAADGQSDAAAMAERVSAEYAKQVSADNIEHLVRSQLRPLGVLTAADGSSPALERPDACEEGKDATVGQATDRLAFPITEPLSNEGEST